jgi:hypothetical protein
MRCFWPENNMREEGVETGTRNPQPGYRSTHTPVNPLKICHKSLARKELFVKDRLTDLVGTDI